MPKLIFHLRYSAISKYAFKFTTITRWLPHYHGESVVKHAYTMHVSQCNIQCWYTYKYIYQKNNLHIGHWKSQKGINIIWYYEFYINLIIYLSNFSTEIKFISQKYKKAGYAECFFNSIIWKFQDRSNQRNIDDSDDCTILLLFLIYQNLNILNNHEHVKTTK